MSTSVMTRRRDTNLEPITTDVTASARRKSSVSAISALSSKSNFSLLSPRLAAAHAYYHEQETPNSAKVNYIQRRKSLLEAEQFPRRHSSAASSSALASHFSNFTFAPRKEKLASVAESEAANSGAVGTNGKRSVNSQIKKEKTEDVEMTDIPKAAPKKPSIKISDTTVTPTPQNTPITARSQPVTPPPARRRSASDVPYEYIHTRLRDWGRVYINNISSADVFINPISLRRPSMTPVSESDPFEANNTINLRARVVPKTKDRKPFVIHQKFNVEDFRAKIPTSGKAEAKTPRLRRSNRHRSSSQGANGHKRVKSLDALKSLSVDKREGSYPLHEEYALHFLPILAALLFSGHVCKGDKIDLPVPHPEAWEDVLKWVYVGGDVNEISEEVRENVAYLGGEVV